MMSLSNFRYVAIVHPLHYSRYMTKLVTRLLMSATWTVALCISLIPIFWNNWHDGVACEMNMVNRILFTTLKVLPYRHLLVMKRDSSGTLQTDELV